MKNKKMEYLIVVIIISISFLLRVWVVENIKVQPESDYKIYYEIAKNINDGSLKEYSNQIKNTTENVFKSGFDINYLNLVDYIAKVPHVYFYPLILSYLFKIFGSSLETGLYFGVFLNILSIIFCYKIGKKISGEFAGLLSMILMGFFPSIIFYNSILGGESIFTFIFLGCIILFYKVKEVDLKSGFRYYSLIILLGILIAVSCALRPIGIIFIIAITIYFLIDTHYTKLSAKYIAVICFLCANFFMSTVILNCTEKAIDKTVANRSSAFGYSLMIGTNKQHNGQWNIEDYRMFFDYCDQLGSETKGQEACLKEGLERIANNSISESLSLIINKYKVLWGNTNFAIDFNYMFMNNQGILTNNIIKTMNNVRVMGNMFYLICTLFTFIYSVSLLKKNSITREYLLVLIILGTVASHLLLEVQNRYQYHIIPIMCILGAIGIEDLYCKIRNNNLIK